MKYLFYYLVGINFVSVIIYGIDKLLAIRNKSRVKEVYLHILSLFGGCLGSILGMLLFRHKTKKLRFYLWNMLMIVFWIYILYVLLW
jgi:uncharacterized membrane protein YsdA (DUF1294 family)